MKNAAMPAMPLGDNKVGEHAAAMWTTGLTKREHFAGKAMAAMLSSNPPMDVAHEDVAAYMDVVAEYADMAALALLTRFEKETNS